MKIQNKNKYLQNVKFHIGVHCELCIEQIEKIEEYFKGRKKDAYGSYEDLNKRKLSKKIVMTPDYNSYGILTHWHIQLVDADEMNFERSDKQ